MATKQLGIVQRRIWALRMFHTSLDMLRVLGTGVWGFTFTEVGEDTKLEVFNNHRDPLPVFIVKVDEAMKIVRTIQPDATLEQLEQEFAQKHAAALDKQPHIIKPN